MIDALGEWRGATGEIHYEKTKIVLFLGPVDSQFILKLDEIRSEYKTRYHQEAVIREVSDAWVSF